jgi:hypothetical protein
MPAKLCDRETQFFTYLQMRGLRCVRSVELADAMGMSGLEKGARNLIDPQSSAL